MKQEVERGITITHKQETLEEAAQKRFPINHNLSILERMGLNSAANMGFIEGAKWQAERMYSEEELQQKIDAHLEVAKDLWLSTIKEQKKMYSEEEVWKLVNKLNETLNIGSDLTLEEWFEQFKK